MYAISDYIARVIRYRVLAFVNESKWYNTVAHVRVTLPDVKAFPDLWD